MRNAISILFCFVQIINLAAQTDSINAPSAFPIDPLAPPSKYTQVLIRDYAFIIDEDSTYSFTVDFIRRIKNAYYIGAHTTVLDSTIYVKIIEPLINKPNKKGIIRVGNSYKMRLIRYFPYPLSHAIDYYINYNFLFGSKIVSLQSTDCLTYIFSTDDLEGLHYINKKSRTSGRISSDPSQNFQDKKIAYKTFISIIQKDKSTTEQLVDRLAVVACAKTQARKYSIVDQQHIQCVPPFRLKTERYLFNHNTKGLNLSEKLYFMMMDACSLYCDYDTSELPSSISIHKMDVVYYEKSYITYRFLWTSSLFRGEFCTYLSFKKSKDEMKLVGICSHLRGYYPK